MTMLCCRRCLLLLVMIAFVSCLDFYEEDFMNDQQTFPPDSPPETPEIRRQLEGSTLVLKCQLTECSDGYKNNFKWEFKHCNSDSKHNSCGKYYSSAFAASSAFSNKWRKVATKSSRSSSCQHEQRISHLKVDHSGLYRCVVNNRTVQLYQVEIVEMEKAADPSPKILEIIPGNVTVAINTQLILQCKVYSPLTPLIVWFKQYDGSKDNLILYNGHYYTKIKAAGDTSFVQKEENVYLSKLNIYKVSDRDNGVYACACVNDNSFNVQTVVVKVQGFENWEGNTSFSLLFLIPLVFALVPITVWLCYYKNKRKVLDHTLLQRKKLIQHTQVPVV